MLPKYEYRRRLPHYQKDDHPLFVTFTSDRRWELPTAARDAVLECYRQENGHKFDLHAAVVMPDHINLIYSPLRRDNGRIFDHVLRSNERVVDRIEYVCQNPVRAGLTRTEGEYRWGEEDSRPLRWCKGEPAAFQAA
jgi:hypothetical protein